MSLEEWGFDETWEKQLMAHGERSGAPGRVSGQDRGRWVVQTHAGARAARAGPGSHLDPYPTVGDWVIVESGHGAADPLLVRGVLPRRSVFSRGSAHDGRFEQALAANVDEVWIVHGLDAPLNPRRLERYLALAWESGARPAVVLTKADLASDLDAVLTQVERLAVGVPVRAVSSGDPESLGALRAGLGPGRTVVLLGPSGVGKSTLLNALAEAPLSATGDVRARDRKGRHTTTRRSLYRLAGGGLVIDTPGIRALRVWGLEEGLERAYPEIDELAASCRFRDCRHETEPGCAVLAAVGVGVVDPGRLAGFRKLQAEAAYEARRSDPRARKAVVAKHKTALKTLEHHMKRKGPS
jgi:ribosome biogenesis GTPase / thiamine phosphate phosphatase